MIRRRLSNNRELDEPLRLEFENYIRTVREDLNQVPQERMPLRRSRSAMRPRVRKDPASYGIAKPEIAALSHGSTLGFNPSVILNHVGLED